MTIAERVKQGWVAIMRTGRHTDTHHRLWTFGEAELDDMASRYDPALSEAPVVLGHPEDNAPAYAWTEKLERDGEFLWAKLKEVAPGFADWVRQGLYRHRSAMFYQPEHPNNPTPGHFYLRHIGFLGGMPPAVKGLPAVALADAEGAITFIEPDQEDCIRGLFRSLREMIIEKMGAETADRVIPSWEIDNLEPRTTMPGMGPGYREPGKEEAMEKTFMDKLVSFLKGEGVPISGAGEKPTTPAPTFTEAQVQEREAAAAKKATDEALRQAQGERRRAEIKGKVMAFVEAGIAAGTFLPAWKEMGLPAVMEHCLLVEQPITFAEGKSAKNPGEILEDFLKGLPKLVTFEEVAGAKKTNAALGAGSAGEKLDALTRKRMIEFKEPYNAAFIEVQRANVELAAQYAEECRSK